MAKKEIKKDSPKILGLDVSTKCIGFALFDVETKNLLELTHISPKPKPTTDSKIEELILKSTIFREKLENYYEFLENYKQSDIYGLGFGEHSDNEDNNEDGDY